MSPAKLSYEDAILVLQRLGVMGSEGGRPVSTWDTLNWFVAMAQKDLDRMTEGERRTLTEEFAALEFQSTLLLNPYRPVPFPEWKTVKQLQQAVFQVLSTWADHGAVWLGPFELSLYFSRMPPLEPKPGIKMPSKPGVGPGLYHGTWEHLANSRQRFLYLLGEYLKELAPAVNRCPHCKRLFLKFRKNARYCSRECHSVAYMRRIRAEENQPRSAGKARRKKGGHSTARKGGSSHGKTKR